MHSDRQHGDVGIRLLTYLFKKKSARVVAGLWNWLWDIQIRGRRATRVFCFTYCKIWLLD